MVLRNNIFDFYFSMNPNLDSGYLYPNFDLQWRFDCELISMTLAYNLSAIPEPETWAMLLSGLGIAGAVARRATTLA